MKQTENIHEVRISSWTRLVCLDVVVPFNCVDDFRAKFGETFDRDNNIAWKVEDHCRRDDGWHIMLVIREEDKYQLQAFVHSYSEAKGLSFKDAAKAETALVA